MSDLLNEHQRQVMGGLLTKHGVDPLSHAALGLAGEAGEVADLIKKSQYMDRTLDKEKLLDELGDVFWYLQYIAGHLGWHIEDLAVRNLEKLSARYPSLYMRPVVGRCWGCDDVTLLVPDTRHCAGCKR